MNLFYYYIKIIKEYFSDKYFLIITFSTVFFVYFLSIIFNYLLFFENGNLVYWHFIAPFFIYISMVFFISCFYYKKISKGKPMASIFFSLLFKSLIIIIIKLVWNFFKVILIESNIVIVNEDSNLYPLFLLGFFWCLIYFIASYFVWFNLLKNKKKLKSFWHYSIKKFWYILFNLFFAFIFSFLLIIIISFVISKIKNIFSFFQQKFVNFFIEDILSISFNVFFAHTIALLFVNDCIKK